jgi:membrane-bound lytic murein transglycosylase D
MYKTIIIIFILIININLSNSSIVKGSSKINSNNKTESGVYFLYGAEHLNLKNYYFDFPVVYNKAVRKWIHYFNTRGRRYLNNYIQRAGRYAPLASKILEGHKLPKDLIFLAMAESGFQNNARSWASAVGTWQFMKFTAKRYGLKINFYIDERRDPIKSAIAASRYLLMLYDMFDSWELATAAYNAGEGKVGRAIKRYGTKSFWKLRKYRYLKRETKEYVPKIMALAIIGKNLSTFGFQDLSLQVPLDFEEVDVLPNSDLIEISEKLKIDFSEIKYYNPELLRWQTPPGSDVYQLRLPIGYKERWKKCCENQSFLAHENYKKYKVKNNNVQLKTVAKKFRLKLNVLKNINKNLQKINLTKNTEVLLPFRYNHSNKERMYKDLYHVPPRRYTRRRAYRKIIKRALRRGRLIKSPIEYYIVKKGDTLWDVARKTGVGINTLIKSNYNIIKRRMIRTGDSLAIR